MLQYVVLSLAESCSSHSFYFSWKDEECIAFMFMYYRNMYSLFTKTVRFVKFLSMTEKFCYKSSNFAIDSLSYSVNQILVLKSIAAHAQAKRSLFVI